LVEIQKKILPLIGKPSMTNRINNYRHDVEYTKAKEIFPYAETEMRGIAKNLVILLLELELL